MRLVDHKRKLTIEVSQATKSNWFSDVKIVAHKHTRSTATVEEVFEMFDDTPCAAIEKKRDRNVANICLVHLHD